MSCKFGHFYVFLSKLSLKKQQIIIKHFKVAKNSIDPNKYHLVKAFSDIKILFISRLVLGLQIFFKTLSGSINQTPYKESKIYVLSELWNIDPKFGQ